MRVVPHHDCGDYMEYLLIEEVHYTMMCRVSFDCFYSQTANRGKRFNWPRIEAVETCPGTGRKVATSPTERRLLVCSRMMGWSLSPDGETMHLMTRILPRILTLQGYENLLGHTPEGSPNRITKVSGPGAKKGSNVLQEIYPDLLRRMAGLKPHKQRKKLSTASDAWNTFNSNGNYTAYEKARP